MDQCLDSVQKGINNCSIEVIVIDNASVDGSMEMVKKKYGSFTRIENKENVGFSKANNQGIEICEGKYVLLLNPDTIVEEDTFSKVIKFMDKHEDAGGLGVRMIDGKGVFLPESKRGLPTPMVAFYKIFGLSKIFPKSKRFGQYHLGHLDEFETNKIDILSGAFMLMRKETLDKIGLLDEGFFMYGEDIDLSYRIQLGGYENYYFPETTIIHYKGESTKKSSVNYVFVFYNAMIIFAKKHFSGKNANLFSFLINLAIYLRAFIALSVRFIKAITLPLIDFAYIVTGLFLLTNYWRMSSIEFPEKLLQYSIPIYAFSWLASAFFIGGYDKPYKLIKLLKGVSWGTIIILLAYAVLPKNWQFSRLFIFIGAGWVSTYYLISRLFLHFSFGEKFNLKFEDKKRFGIIGSNEEITRVKELLVQTNTQIEQIIPIQIEQKINGLNIDELIFCSNDIHYSTIIQKINQFKDYSIDFKIAPPKSNHLIGSNSIDTAGDLYILNINTLINRENLRKKRLFDLIFSSLMLISAPLFILFFKNKKRFIQNITQVLVGKKSFVGFSEDVAKKDVRLPIIKQSLLSPIDAIEIKTPEIQEKLNLLYARDYSMRKDFSILLKAWRKLD